MNMLEKFQATRTGFGVGLVEIGKNKDVTVLTADLADSTGVGSFRDSYPDRFFELGVAEQNLVTVASGMAAEGMTPFVSSYAVFSPGRNWEQIRTTICYNQQPVKIMSTHAGLNVGADGATHQALEDLALMRSLPGMIVLSPYDSESARLSAHYAYKIQRPVYIRLAREASPVFSGSRGLVTSIQRAHAGSDVTVLVTGPIAAEAWKAVQKLAPTISCDLLLVTSIKPLDVSRILASVRKTRAVVTIEEHQMAGGFGSAVAEVLAEKLPVPHEFVAVRDQFGQSGTAKELLRAYGLSSDSIIRAIKKVIRRKP